MLKQIREIWADKEGLYFLVNQLSMGFAGMIIIYGFIFFPVIK